MTNPGRRVLEALLDRYERSGHARGAPGRAVTVRVDDRLLPGYWNDTSAEHRRSIHQALGELVQDGLVELRWKRLAEGLELERVALRLQALESAYRRIGRTPPWDQARAMGEVLGRAPGGLPDWAKAFVAAAAAALDAGHPLPAGLQLGDAPLLETLLTVMRALDPDRPLPRRVFSQRVLGSSKGFEEMVERRLLAVLRAFHPLAAAGAEDRELLGEVGLTDGPDHLLLAGPLVLGLDDGRIETDAFRPYVGLPASMIARAAIVDLRARHVLTVENLTTFHLLAEGQPPGVLLVYLGGYHNAVRRDFLGRLHRAVPSADFFHWGDIDFGGFQIFRTLREGSGVPFRPFRMDLATYRAYADTGMTFDQGYGCRLERLAGDPACAPFHAVISEMLALRRRVEQEAVDVWPLDLDAPSG